MEGRTPVSAEREPEPEPEPERISIRLPVWAAETKAARARLDRALKLYKFLVKERQANERDPGRSPKSFPQSYGPGTFGPSG